MRRTLVAACSCAVVFGFMGPGVVLGQETQKPEEQGVPLTLAHCLETALKNNLDLVIARKDPQIAGQDVQLQEAKFDPTLAAGASHDRSKQEIFSAFSTDQSETTGANVAWKDPLFFGGEYDLTLSSTKRTASGPLIFVPSSYQSSLSLTYTMPLLRGLGSEVAGEQILLSRGNLAMSREDLRKAVHASLESVEGAYWNLVASREASRVARQALSLAQDLLTLNRKKVDVGTLAPIEITQAEAGVASREEGVISAETLVQNSEDELRRLMGVPKDDPIWDQRIVPADEPTFEPKPTELSGSISTALAARPELVSARQDLRNKELSERVAENALKPSLALSAAVTPSGNNFMSVAGGGAVEDGSLTRSLSEIHEFRNYDWNVGLTYSIPVGNRASKASYATATLVREKSEISLQNLEQNIRVEVRTAVRNVESGAKRIAAARSNVTLQRKKLEAEQKKFENGMSTSFEVLTFQNDLLSAQLAEIQAITDYNKALVALERAQGTLLEARGLRLEP